MLQQIVDIRQQMWVAIGQTNAIMSTSRHGIKWWLRQFHLLIIAVIQGAIGAATVAPAPLTQIPIGKEFAAAVDAAVAIRNSWRRHRSRSRCHRRSRRRGQLTIG